MFSHLELHWQLRSASRHPAVLQPRSWEEALWRPSREQQEPPQSKASSTRWQPTAAEHKHPSSGPCGPPSSADSSTDLQERNSDDSSPRKENCPHEGTRVGPGFRGFLQPTPLSTHLLFSSSSFLFLSSSCLQFPSLHHILYQSCLFPCRGKWN